MKTLPKPAAPNLLNRLTRLFAKRTTSPDRVDGVRVMSFRGSAAGLTVTADDALKVSAVWACVQYLGRTVGQLPWRVYRDINGQKELQPLNQVDWLLHKRPNPEMSAMQFKQTMVGWAALHGNAVAEIEWDMRGVPRALWPINPNRLSFERSKDDGGLLYVISNDSGYVRTKLRGEDVFHLPGYGDGPIGHSAVDYAADSIGWARATEIFSGAMFGRGAHPSGIIKHKRKLSVEALETLKAEFQQLYVGPRNAQNVMFLDSEMEWESIDKSSTSQEFVETRQHQVEEICRWFGVPPHKVQHLLRSTFNNIEHQSIEVVVDSITPWAIKLEQEADAKLFSPRSSLYTKLDLNGLMRGDFKSRTDGYKTLWAMGVLSTNEIRALEDWNPIGANGDKRVAPLNMTTLDKLGEESPQPRTRAIADEGTQNETTDGSERDGNSAAEERNAA